MEAKPTRSERVIEDFKKHKLASSVLKQIHRIIKNFEEDEKLDRHLAGLGLVVLAILTGLTVYMMGVF